MWAWRRERMRHDRPQRRPDARAVSVRAAALRSGGHPGDLRRPSDGAGRGDARDAARDARRSCKLSRRRRCSRCCPAAGCRRSRCTPISCSRPRRASRGTRRRALPGAVRDARDARRVRGAHAPHRARALPITLLYGHAEDALRAADVGIVASGTATLEAALARCPHVIFYRVSAIDGLARHAQAPVAVCRIAQRARRTVRRARVPAGPGDAAQPRAGRAQPLRRHGDAAQARGALRRLRATRCAPTPARSRAMRWRQELARGRRRVLSGGIDEAGRGPLAGPVFAAAVILDPGKRIRGLARLQGAERPSGASNSPARSVLRPSRGRWRRPTCTRSTPSTSCRRRCLRCGARWRRSPSCRWRRSSTATSARDLRVPCLAIVKGDRDVASISAASILAKTARDALMRELDALYPSYGFAQNKGYGTPEHLAALDRFGPCAVHRRSFAPVVQISLQF